MNLHEKVFRYVLLTLMCGLSLCVAGTSHANDRKGWSGAQCSPNGNSTQLDISVRAEGIQNNSLIDKWVVCSLTRDAEAIYSAGQLGAFIAVTGTRSSGGSVTCILTKGDVAHPPVQQITRTLPTSTANWGFSFGGNDLVSSQWQLLSISCRLPPKAQLGAIEFNDFVDTDI